ncbi:(deoxy)nucleoside triphosphate pyrophosphohydrolase [Luteolibacter yonseiensis]|uniref:8-oxo-dGTP diphosphatase n=1 Tax=Luteolibacter yonseiensis TaxID=1144680 RepID=A0A934VB48_9BACT|nr:(deoxy)nucleoside triphosphate pyrophosphohydrolase [Luteolibacter yonseiensis]MBK1815556.1 (deoxy)nucleoside triphosphate pyrophosphohydrolase [Luteolibacter yonseiensis]
MLEVVCGVIEDSEGRFLACLRPAGKHLGGLWEFPGGKIDPGESPDAALVRELKEELAVDVEVGRALTPVVWNYGEITIRLQPFICRIVSGELRALEHEELRWCAPADFPRLPWADADIPILREIFPTG